MTINKVNFGEIEVQENDIITFDQPIYGFEENKRYVFMMDDSLNGEFIWLQSVDDGGLCFVMANPNILSIEYNPVFSEDISGVIGKGTYEMWLIMVVTDDFKDSTVNLKSPVIINTTTGVAAQIILEQDYPVRHPIMEGEK